MGLRTVWRYNDRPYLSSRDRPEALGYLLRRHARPARYVRGLALQGAGRLSRSYGLWRAGHSGLLAEGLKDHLRRALRRVRREERGGGEQGLRGSACQWRQG